MKMINCIVIEDEPIARAILVDYISKIHYLELSHEFDNAIDALPILEQEEVDLIFLDIHLPIIKGLDFLKSLRLPPAVIVTTAYHQYAVEGFELNVLDYLLKPFPFERFLNAVNRINKKQLLPIEDVIKREKFIFVMANKRKTKIVLDSIEYIESSKEYVKIFTETGVIKTKMRLTNLYELLTPDGFARPHRSFVVSIKKIKSYDQSNVEITDKNIPIGKIYRENFIDTIKGN